MSTMGSEVTQPTQQSGSSAKEMAQSVVRDYLEQLSVTSLAVKHWWIQQYRKTRMAVKDIRDACIQIIEEEPQTKGGKGSVIDALADTSPMVCCDTDKFCLQETYFGISILVLSLTLGGIVGNLWTEFSWGPQLSVLQALLVIIMLPLQIYYGFCDLPSAESIVKRRSALYLMLFFMGFSMGRLCQYSLVSTAPRIIPPLALAFMIDKFVHINPRKNPPPSGIRGTRIEMFLAVTVFSLFIVWCHLLLLRRLTLGSFFVSFLCVAINLQLLFTHFQLFFYGLCTLGEKWNLETMKEETDSHGHGHHRHHHWNLDNVNRWLAHSDIAFIIAMLTLDVLLCTLY